MANRYDALRYDYAGLPDGGGSLNQRALKKEIEGEIRLSGGRPSNKVLRAEARRVSGQNGGEIVPERPQGIPSSLFVFPESPEVAHELYTQPLANASVQELVSPDSAPRLSRTRTIFQRAKNTIVNLVKRV